jgi:hypothetical protein
MTTPTQPGWYDDPEDSKARRYWDGQTWTPRRERKPVSGPTPQPVASPPTLPRPSASPPPSALPPPVAGAQPRVAPASPAPPPVSYPAQPPVVPKGPSGGIKIGLIAAAGLVLLVVIVALVAGQHVFSGPPAPSGRQPAPSGQKAAPQHGTHNPASRSPAYREGYDVGYQHMGNGHVPFNMDMGAEFDCNLEAGSGRGRDVARTDRPDWIKGCMDGYNAMLAESGGATSSSPNWPSLGS